MAAEAEPPADEQKAPRAGVWARFVAASFLIIISMATATAVSALVYLTDIAKGLGGLEGLSGQLADIDTKAQNFLILGSDVRPTDGNDRGRSDTTMLLRVDPDRDLITQLSIPRDLEVNIPGHGVDKFNAAYSYGGPKLTLEVVDKSITGGRVPIHHVVNVDFNGFADAVNAIDCVYVDVDRHYFHSNEGLAFADQYAEIDIQAGYQRLCGFKALQYVRYRHEDNDLVRGARQQGFLREARQKVPPDKLLDQRQELIDIFTKYTTSDIDRPSTLVELFKLMLDARGAQVTQIDFRTTSLGNAEGYVTASDEGLNAAIDEFLGVGGATEAAPEEPEDEGDGGKKGSDQKGDKGKDEPEERPAPATPADARLHRVRPAVRGRDPQPVRGRAQVPAAISHSDHALRHDHGRLAVLPHRRAGQRHLSRVQVRDVVPVAQRLHRLLRRLGHGLAERAPVREPQRGAQDRGARVLVLLRRGPAADARVRARWHEVLGHQLARQDPDGAADAGNRPEPRGRRIGFRAPMSEQGEAIGVIGVGWVGLVTAACFAELGRDVVAMDVDERKVASLHAGEATMHEPGIAELLEGNRERLRFTTDMDDVLGTARLLFCCVDTPPTYSGDADLSRVQAVVSKLGDDGGQALVMKSTVPAGTGATIRREKPSLAYVSCPEFLKEGSAVADFLHPDRVVIGADEGDEWAADAVEELYRPLGGELVRTDVASAEMIKLASNAFLATKISFINEIANVSEEVGADVTEVARGMGLDQRIGASFLQAGIGYGGSCFPKDVSALKQLAGNTGYHFQLLTSVIEVNELQKRRVMKKLEKHLGSLVGRRVALLGLAFKPNTDDMREASSLVLSARLQGEGAIVRAFDPVAEPRARELLPNVEFTASVADAVADADAVILVTEWAEFAELDWAGLAKRMSTPLIVDGRNFLDPAALRDAGFTYEGIGRPAPG